MRHHQAALALVLFSLSSNILAENASIEEPCIDQEITWNQRVILKLQTNFPYSAQELKCNIEARSKKRYKTDDSAYFDGSREDTFFREHTATSKNQIGAIQEIIINRSASAFEVNGKQAEIGNGPNSKPNQLIPTATGFNSLGSYAK